MKTPTAINPQIAGNLEAFKARFDVPRATFILHGAEKFEIRFRASRVLEVAPNLLFMGILFLFGAFWIFYYAFVHNPKIRDGVVDISHRVDFFMYASLIFCLLFVVLFIMQRLVSSFGISVNASLRIFTIWRNQFWGNRSNTTITFHDTREFQIQPDSRVALVAKGGRKIPFTFPLAPEAAEALQAFLRSVAFPDFLHNPRLEKSDTPQSAGTKFLLKQRGPDLMRFYQRAQREPEKILTKRNFPM